MATAEQVMPQSPRSFEWVLDFLRDELAPYPGRVALVARMVVAASIVMVATMVFRIPYGAYGAVYALTISRENPETTLKAVRIILISYPIGAAYVLVGAFFFSGDPLLRLLWVAASLFIMFYALSALTNFTAAGWFGYLVAITIPLWDQNSRAELRVEDTLWAVGAISFASLITAAVELVFHRIKPVDDLSASIAQRLQAIETLLGSYIGATPDKFSERQIQRLSMLGTSRMRRDLQRSGYTPQYAEQMGAVVAYVGWLVDLAANLAAFSERIPAQDPVRLRKLADTIAIIRNDLLDRRIPAPVDLELDEEPVGNVPLVREMEVTVSHIAEVFTGTQPLSAFAAPSAPSEARKGLFAADAFSNPRHLRFGIRGGLAAFVCYVIYNSVAWPGISTAVTTCLLTALTTIGSSRQKQALRFGGAIVGGAIGIAAQVFILPSIDSIAAFLVLFVAVTIFASWLATCGPRLSYFGIQVAVAFYIIHLQEFKFQTSLAVARDRVAGVLLGLIVMRLIFDQLWSASPSVEMMRTFAANLRIMAQLTREPAGKDFRTNIEKTHSLRETINANFDLLRQQADGIMLAFGSSRERDLVFRAQVLQWQLQLRMVFLTRVALLKYRFDLPGFELPEPMQAAQQRFDDRQARILEGMADRLADKATQSGEKLNSPLAALEEVVKECCPSDSDDHLIVKLRTFLPLSRRFDELIRSLDQAISPSH